LPVDRSRAGDVVARVGGEEFLALLPDTDLDGTVLVAERIRRLVAAMAVPKNHETVTVSLGAAAWQRDDLDAASVLRRADTALYDAKEGGRNRVMSHPSHSLAHRHCTSEAAFASLAGVAPLEASSGLQSRPP